MASPTSFMSPRIPLQTLLLATVLLSAAGGTEPVGAQIGCSSVAECPGQLPNSDVAQDFQIAAANALLGGVSAAAIRFVRGESVWRSFWTGAAGGVVTYAGKRVVVQEFGGAGLLGRGMASVGSSIVLNAADGRHALDRVALPFGPVRFYVSRESGLDARLDLATVIAAASFMVAHDAKLDPAASLSSGALVLRGNAAMPGLSSAGAMMVWDDLPASEGPRLMAHERVHILQYDQLLLSVGDRAERWILGKARVPTEALRFLDVGGLAVGLRAGLSVTMDYHMRPWETEAYYLAAQAHPK